LDSLSELTMPFVPSVHRENKMGFLKGWYKQLVTLETPWLLVIWKDDTELVPTGFNSASLNPKMVCCFESCSTRPAISTAMTNLTPLLVIQPYNAMRSSTACSSPKSWSAVLWGALASKMSRHEDNRKENSRGSLCSGNRDISNGLFYCYKHDTYKCDEMKRLTCFPMTAIQAIAGARPTVAAIWVRISVSTGKCHTNRKSSRRCRVVLLRMMESCAKTSLVRRIFHYDWQLQHWSVVASKIYSSPLLCSLFQTAT